MKLPVFRRTVPDVKINYDLVLWRLDFTEPLPTLSREELLSRLWIDRPAPPRRVRVSRRVRTGVLAAA